MVEFKIGCVTGNTAQLLDKAVSDGKSLSFEWNDNIDGQLDLYVEIESCITQDLERWMSDERLRIAQAEVIPKLP